MSRKWLCLPAALLVVATVFTPITFAQNTVGYLAFDSNAPGASFDIVNVTGANSAISPDANPVTSTVDLTSLSLTVDYLNGSSTVFGSSYFTISGDGISWDGTGDSSFISATNPAVSAVLSGDFAETTFTLADSSTVDVDSSFSTTISGSGTSGALVAGTDFALIQATPSSSGPPATPEPASFLMVGTGLTALAGFRRRFLMSSIRKFATGFAGLAAVLAVSGVFLLTPVSAQAQVNLTSWASPSTGLAGYNSSTLTGSGFPSGTISPSSVTVSFAASCGGAAVATEAPATVAHFIASTDHVGFAIPGSLAAGNYFVSISGTSPAFSSSNCSEITVTASSTTLAACVPTSSLAVVAGANVNAYVPNGYWDASNTGIEEVPLEGTGTAKTFTTPGVVNSCAANSSTGEVICTENTANVDLISGPASTSVSTITSGSNSTAGFSGGSCYNCGVGVNAANNTAVIAMGLSGSPSGSGVQVLNLSDNSFDTPFPLRNVVSEDISIDSGRNLILSPGEGGTYDLLKIGAGNSLTEYGNYISPVGEPDSAAEDCTTGIALASLEFSDYIYIADLTQATFGASTWTAPGQQIDLADGGTYGGFSAGTCGISTAPGTGHLAVVTGEFGGSSFAILQLPSTSGSGTPALADYAYAGQMPNTPDSAGFSAGYDPHTVTAYTSPNNSKSYAVFADYANFTTHPSWLGIVDMACALALPRDAGTHNITSPGTALTSCVRYVAVP